MKQKLKTQQNNKSRVVEQRIEYFGILPPPYMMEQYEKIQPGTADRILEMAENQLKHSQQLEANEHKNIIECRSKTLHFDKLGQLYGFIIIFCCVIGGFILVLNDKAVGGYATIITSILTVIGTVIYKNKKN